MLRLSTDLLQRPLWEKAIEGELATLNAAGTWELEEALPGANVIGSKWAFKLEGKAKKDATGRIVRYKARLRWRASGVGQRSLGDSRVFGKFGMQQNGRLGLPCA